MAGRTPQARSTASRSIPRRTVGYRGTTFEEMDIDGRDRPSDRRSPSWTSWPTPTRPGPRHEKRWQDVEELRDAGIDVISTVNIQHLESLNDVVERITGVKQQETIPDEVVRAGRPGRAGRHGARGAAPADGARQHLRAGEGRRRPRATTSGSATSARCASSP